MASGVELTELGLGERDMSTITPPDHSGPAQLAAQWARIRGRLQQDVGEVEYRTWLRQMTLAGVDGDEIALHLPTRFLRDWVREHYADRLSTLWQAENAEVRRVDIRVGGGAPAMNGLARVSAATERRTPTRRAALRAPTNAAISRATIVTNRGPS